MKNSFLLVLMPALLLNLSACSEQKKSDSKNDKWTLVWEDDFKLKFPGEKAIGTIT